MSVTHFAELPLSLFRISHFHLHFFSFALARFLSDIVREFHSPFIRKNLFERVFSYGLRAQFVIFPHFNLLD